MSFDLEIPLLGIYPNEIITNVLKDFAIRSVTEHLNSV